MFGFRHTEFEMIGRYPRDVKYIAMYTSLEFKGEFFDEDTHLGIIST